MKDKAREEAWAIYAKQTGKYDTWENPNIEFSAAFDLGYQAAQPAWREINGPDDLPKRSGHYWVTRIDGAVQKAAFYVGAFNVNAVAWLPDNKPEPFQGGRDTDEN